MSTDDAMTVTLAAANEALRVACHASFTTSATPAETYARTGQLYAILTKVEQVTDTLRRHAIELATSPPPGLYSDDTNHPGQHARAADGALLEAATRVRRAHAAVNEAWSSLSHLGVREQPDDGGA